MRRYLLGDNAHVHIPRTRGLNMCQAMPTSSMNQGPSDGALGMATVYSMCLATCFKCLGQVLVLVRRALVLEGPCSVGTRALVLVAI